MAMGYLATWCLALPVSASRGFDVATDSDAAEHGAPSLPLTISEVASDCEASLRLPWKISGAAMDSLATSYLAPPGSALRHYGAATDSVAADCEVPPR